MQLPILALLFTVLAATDVAGEPFALAKGERWAPGDAGVALTLRSVSDDSGCLAASDCSQMLFQGSIVIEREGREPALHTVQGVLTPGSSVDLPFDGGRFELIGVKTVRGKPRASFRLVMDPPEPPPPKPYLELAADERRQADAAFLADHGRRAGVVTTSTGLQYAVLDPGGGAHVADGSRVVVQYRAVYSDGTPVVADAPPVSDAVPPDDLVPGLREGVMLMREGARYRFVVPPGLGLDANGRRGRLRIEDAPRDAVLVFDLIVTGVAAR